MANFRKENGKIVLNVPYAEAYLPEELVMKEVSEKQIGKSNSTVASFFGDGFQTLGLMNMRFFKSDEEERESAELRTLNYPNTIITFPSDHELKTLQLHPTMDPDKYYILKYYEGDVIMDASIPKKSSNCEDFMDILIRGKIPYGIKYDDLYFTWVKNFAINNIDPDVPGLVLQIMIAEICRLRNDSKIPFRKRIGKEELDALAYRVYNMVNIASGNSVITALSFERFAYMLTTSLNMSINDIHQKKSPLEEVLSY